MSSETIYRAIAIDGPAASGKSTVAKQLAKQLGLIMVNSGAMYRAIAWKVKQEGIDPQKNTLVEASLEKWDLSCEVVDGASVILVNGVNPGDALREKEVNAIVSTIAAIPKVRDCLLSKQREFLHIGDLVMEGRDIGTVIFPNTPYKFFITASEKVRASRRSAEGLTDQVAERDRQDSQRKTAPLRAAEDAVVIDSSEMTISEVVDTVKAKLKERGWEQR